MLVVAAVPRTTFMGILSGSLPEVAQARLPGWTSQISDLTLSVRCRGSSGEENLQPKATRTSTIA